MHNFAYVATLAPASAFAAGETGFVVTFPDLPETITQGEDETDPLAHAADALEEAVAADRYHSSIDMATTLHPQTTLALDYGDAPLPAKHGLPLKLRVPTKLGSRIPSTSPRSS